jgi:site-specific DNA recombinase
VRAALYARFSSELQRAASIEDQFRNCRKRAEAEAWTIIATFADQAISGSDANRPQYRAMLSAAEHHEFDVLVVDDLSRLTRDAVECERVIRRLEFSGLRIVATSDGYDSTSKARKVHRGVKGLMNEIFLDDLRQRVHRGLEGQAIKSFWCGGRPYGYRLQPIADASRLDPYGNPAKVGTKLVIDKKQASVVREIFERYVAGESCSAIAAALNSRAIPSPGSSWKRVTRRSNGWARSGVRVILLNPLYTGAQRWNVSRFERDPDSGKTIRRRRPKSEWVVSQLEELRIIDDQLFDRAKARTRSLSDGDSRLKAGGKSKFMLSGLLKCEVCGANYVIADRYSYACGSFLDGASCTNRVRVNRVSLENAILGPVRAGLRDSERVKRMAAEMEKEFSRAVQASQARTAAAPRELQAIDERLVKLRLMPDLTDDERQTLIERIEAKRRDLKAARPAMKQSALILSLLPKAAKAYLKQIDEGLSGDLRAAAKGRIVLKDMLGPIRLAPGGDGSLWASYRYNPAALIRAAGTVGRGDRI